MKFEVGDRVRIKHTLDAVPAWQGITGTLTSVSETYFSMMVDPGQDAPAPRTHGGRPEVLLELISPPTPEEIEEVKRNLDAILASEI